MKNENEKSEDELAIKKSSKTIKPKTPIPEAGGRGGLDPSRFGDWEIAGKCVDF